MPAVQVRSLPDDIYAQLVQAARDDERSIAQQITYYIKRGLERRSEPPTMTGVVDRHTGITYHSHKARRQAVMRELDKFHKVHGTVDVDFDDINRIIEEGHEERAERIMKCLS